MPIHVTIAVNERTVETVHIARVSGGSGRVQGKEYEYAALNGAEPRTDDEWDAGARFTHPYGSGLYSLVNKGLSALDAKRDAERAAED